MIYSHKNDIHIHILSMSNTTGFNLSPRFNNFSRGHMTRDLIFYAYFYKSCTAQRMVCQILALYNLLLLLLVLLLIIESSAVNNTGDTLNQDT